MSLKIPGTRKSPEDGECRHNKTKWYGPFNLTLGPKQYTYRQKKCVSCGKLLKNSTPKEKK